MLRKVEGNSRGVSSRRERREKVLKEVVGHCLVETNLGLGTEGLVVVLGGAGVCL